MDWTASKLVLELCIPLKQFICYNMGAYQYHELNLHNCWSWAEQLRHQSANIDIIFKST
jgi:hypothetical protein